MLAVWTAAWCGLATPLVGGCFLPQDDQVLPTVPDQRNRPPRLIPLRPSSRVTSGNQDPDCPSLDFSAAVEDLDLGDLISVRWFIDPTYSPDEDRPYRESRILPSESALRGEKAEIRIPVVGASPLATAGNHTIELLIADGVLINRDPQPITRPGAPDGGVYQDTSYVDEHSWNVVITNGAQDCPKR